MENYIEIGRLYKPHGLTGAIKVSIDDHYLEDFARVRLGFVELRGEHVPVFVEYVRLNARPPIAKFEELDNRDDVTKIAGKALLMRARDITVPEADPYDDMEYGHIVGYRMVDTELGDLGEVTDLEEYPQQEMAEVTRPDDSTVLIPLHDALIDRIDAEAQCIYVTLPEGLLDL